MLKTGGAEAGQDTTVLAALVLSTTPALSEVKCKSCLGDVMTSVLDQCTADREILCRPV